MTRSVALVFCVVCVLLSRSAGAKPRIALTEIAGDASGDVRDAVADALAGNELLLIGNFAVDRAVGKLGDVTEFTEKDFKRLASELAADAVVSGKLGRAGASRTLKFRLFVGKKLTKGFTMSFKDPRSEKLRTVLHDKMLARIGVGADAETATDSERDDEARPARKPRAKLEAKADADDDDEAKDVKPMRKAKGKLDAESEDEDIKPARKPKAKLEAITETEDDDEAAGGSATQGDDVEKLRPRRAKKVATADDSDVVAAIATVDRAPSPSSLGGAEQRAVWVAAGPSVLQRSLTFVATNIQNKPRNVSLSPIGGAYTSGEIYPGALLGSRGVAADFGLGFEYEQQAGAQVQVANTMNTTVPFKQLHYSISARFRHAFGSSATSPVLTLHAGYGQRYAAADPRALTDTTAQQAAVRDTPPIIYTLFDPGVAFRLPLTGRIAVTVDARAMVVTDAGPIQTAQLYGTARVFGGSGAAALDIKLGSRFDLAIAAEFSQIAFSFTGNGALSTMLDGNATTKDVAGLADRTIGGWATLGVAY